MRGFVFIISITLSINVFAQQSQTFIRVNQLGYTTKNTKVAVWCSKQKQNINKFELVDYNTNTVVYRGNCVKKYGGYGPFVETYRLNFTNFQKPGKYFLRTDSIISPTFYIDDNVYKGTANFCLQYMRQQRSGFNPFLQDSCHTQDGYTLYTNEIGLSDSTFINVSGGWHDASDYLQYGTTTANATYHLLMAYRDFKDVFKDEKKDNGLQGSNGMKDILDEAKWGLDWLLKMHPNDSLLFNQLGDDRDHISMRMPKLDSQYGKAFQRPVYFINGKPQQRGKYLNNTTGTTSTAAKYSSAFALGSEIFNNINHKYADTLFTKCATANLFALKKLGVTQTVSVKSPYIYAEDNFTDDIELSLLAQYRVEKNKHEKFYKPDELKIVSSYFFAKKEPVTPWLGKDTAHHYQWYPFINIGHYELAKELKDKRSDTLISFYKNGIEKVFAKAKQNAFYRGIPFIWCSNNLTVAFATQCYWYRRLTNSPLFTELEQANIDWLFGCNPWGTSMVYGLPNLGDSPTDPHSAFTHIKGYPINGGLVDGPVYTSIYKNLIGINLHDVDEYAHLQSDLAVYHDDYGDYSTNEPTMDGTANLIYLLAAKENETKTTEVIPEIKTITANVHGAIVQGNKNKKEIALVFTAHEFGEGLPFIHKILQQEKVKASFFFTGDFYRNKNFEKEIKKLQQQKHFLGAHSDKHLLYCDWKKRDSLLVNYTSFSTDYNNNLQAMENLGIDTRNIHYFIAPYEWWNDSVATWCSWKGLKLFSFTPNTKTNADYTYPEMGSSYKSSDTLLQHIKNLELQEKLNGNILLLHAGTDARRKDKFYNKLQALIIFLRKQGYAFKRIDEMF